MTRHVRAPIDALGDIRQAISVARKSVGDLSESQFYADDIRRAAAERAVSIISEAVRHLPLSLLNSAPHIPWCSIRGIGNHIRHAYWLVEPIVIYVAIQDELDVLDAFARDHLG